MTKGDEPQLPKIDKYNTVKNDEAASAAAYDEGFLRKVKRQFCDFYRDVTRGKIGEEWYIDDAGGKATLFFYAKNIVKKIKDLKKR